MTKEKLVLTKNPKSKLPHKNKLKEKELKTSDTLNEKASHIDVSSPEKNYEFNTKTTIPEGMEIAFKDGNKKNVRFSNLKLQPIKEKKKEVKEEKK